MGRQCVIPTVIVVSAMAVIAMVQTLLVVRLLSDPVSPVREPAERAALSSSDRILDLYVKPALAPTASIVAAFIAGVFGYRSLLRNLRTSTRNSFLDMLVSNKSHRDELDAFLSAAASDNFNDLSERINDAALHYLFILKPKSFKDDFNAAIGEKNSERVHELIRQLFSA